MSENDQIAPPATSASMGKDKDRERKLIHSVSIAEFDIDIGNTLAARYPDFELRDYDHQALANLCLPDGGHIHQEDWTYIVIKVGEDELTPGGSKKKKDKDKDKDKDGNDNENMVTLYGVALFRNVRDETVRRGAIQKSMLILSLQPFFNIYVPVMRAAIVQFMDHDDKKALKTVYETLNSSIQKTNQVTLWGEAFPLIIPKLDTDNFGGVSLIDLVKKFKEDTVLIWYSLLMELRVLFTGQPAHEVGNCALAAPLLVAPLHGFSEYICPYVALTDISPIERTPYICGTTNLMFEQRTDWYDTMGSFTSCNVIHQGPIRVTGRDREFIKNLCSGVEDNKGELWVREQFRQYTEAFLRAVAQDRLKGQQKKLLYNFKQTAKYERYLSERKAQLQAASVEESLSAVDHLTALNDPDSQLTSLEVTKRFYEMHKNLVNLSNIEDVCDADGVAVVAKFLSENSVQVRKYAALSLAQLAISIKGQIAILSGSVLDKIIEMLNDTMPNVSNAACQCLVKISSLFIGVHALLERGVPETLNSIIANPETNLVMKTRAAQALLQCYRMCPAANRVDASLIRPLLDSPDKNLASILLQLFDTWGEEIPKIPLSDKMRHHIAALQSEETDTRAEATSYLLSDLIANNDLTLELVEGGGVMLLLQNEKLVKPEHKLARLSFATLSLVADTHHGRAHLLGLEVVEQALAQLKIATDPLYLYHLVRFIEVSAQHPSTALRLFESDGINTILEHIVRYHSQALVNTVCLPALGALKYLLLSIPEIIQDVQPTVEEHLRPLYIEPESREGVTAVQDTDLQEAIWVVLKLVS